MATAFTGRVSTIFCEGSATQVQLADPITESLIATGTGGGYLTLDPGLSNYASLFSLLMAAGANKLTTKIVMSDDDSKLINSVSFDFPG